MNRKLLIKALGLSTVVAVALLLAGSWFFSRSTGESPELQPGAGSVQFAPIASADLEAIYHEAWLAVPQESLDQDKFADWSQWEHKFDGKLRTEKQLRDAISQMLASLGDRYQVVMTASEVVAFDQASSGKVVGIGVNMSGSTITSVASGTPADKAGLKPGDVIAYVNNWPVPPGSTPKMLAALRGDGKPGTKLTLTVLRDKKQLTVELTREVIKQDKAVRTYIGRQYPMFWGFGFFRGFPNPFMTPGSGIGGGTFAGMPRPMPAGPKNPQQVAGMVGSAAAGPLSGMGAMAMQSPYDDEGGFHWEVKKDSTGGVRVDNLRSDTVISELDSALQEMEKESMEGIVLDLRNVKGGSAMTAAQAAALFMAEGKLFSSVERVGGKLVSTSYELKGGKLVVTTTVAGGEPVVTVVDTPVNRYGKPVFVVVDGKTTGAAELIASALQGNHRATVYGANTRGKATGQKNFKLSRGYVLRLTVARYSDKDGQPLDGVGVKPDMQGDTVQGNLYGQAVLALRDHIEKNRPKAEVKPAGGNESKGESKGAGAGDAPKGDAKPSDGNSPAGTVKPADGNAPKGAAKP